MSTDEQEIREWIEDASMSTGCAASIVPESQAKEIISRVKERYVFGQPTWWWTELKLPYSHFDSTTVKLSEVLPSLDGDVHLIPDNPHDEGTVFRVKAREVEAILNECPFFEYSVSDLRADWLVMESHHDVFYLCRWAERGSNSNLP